MLNVGRHDMTDAVHPRRRTTILLAAVVAVLACTGARAADAAFQAPNVVPVSVRLVTSGQPTADTLDGLSAQGFGAVIYLAPLTVSDAGS